MTARRVVWILSVCVAILAMARVGSAQEVTISGAITDSTGLVVPGVTVTATHAATGNTSMAVTDERGEYRLALRIGVYKITAELPGFATVTRDGVELLLGQQATVNLKMSPSNLEETVTVRGDSPLVDVTQSKLGGNIDARQVQELPLNGRNWLDLTLLAAGNRSNASGTSPVPNDTGGFQLNLDGQQVTNNVSGSTFGNARFNRDALAEFEFISNRFDATQGRSMQVQVNAVTKSGTNLFSGTASGYFRDDAFNSKDFIVNRVLDYSDQQLSATFGGPVIKDRTHFFLAIEGEREPQSFTFTTPYPAFNIPDLHYTHTEKNGMSRFDHELKPGKHLMVRANYWTRELPFSGGGSNHPSTAQERSDQSGQFFTSFNSTLGRKSVNEVLFGYYGYHWLSDGVVHNAPQIALRGLTIGKSAVIPQDISQKTFSIRDNFATLVNMKGSHEIKVGGEFLYEKMDIWWYAFGNPLITASTAAIPANIESLFPVWNDPSTWNIAALSPITVRVKQSVGTYDMPISRPMGALWFQDNWSLTKALTINLGVRYDACGGCLGEDVKLPLFRPDGGESEWFNIGPRLGFAYALNDSKTVIRGGWGKYFGEVDSFMAAGSQLSLQAVAPDLQNDGRADFASNPFNGPLPTLEQALRLRHDGSVATQGITDPNFRSPYAYQASIGVQQQINETLSVDADYVKTQGYRNRRSRNINLAYNPATGTNFPFTDVSKRPYPEWGTVLMKFGDGRSDYDGLQMAVTKRFSHRWQASGTYTLSTRWDDGEGAASGGGELPDNTFDLAAEWAPSVGSQRHRAVFNGIWELPYNLSLSGLYFYGSGTHFATSYGGDQRNTGNSSSGRLRPDGTVVPRNSFVGKPLHRVDMRLMKKFRFTSKVGIDLSAEVFNVFNHKNFGSYVLTQSSANYGSPQQNNATAYQPRSGQLGFRFVF